MHRSSDDGAGVGAERPLGPRLRRYDWGTALRTALGTSAAVLALVFVTREILGWDFEEATRSPLAAASRPWGPAYEGWLGALAVLGWTATAALSAFAAGLGRRRGDHARSRLLAGSAALSTLLLLDDLFLVHHTLAPQRLGVPEHVVLALLVLLALVWGFAGRRTLVEDPDLPVLLWAALAYATALTIDVAGEIIGWGGVREEAAKLTGVAAWFVFHWRIGGRTAGLQGVVRG
jgi:hypothetical protein